MGQRTAFLIKRTYWNGDVNIRLVHHQWGIGRVMHNLFIRDFFEMITYRGFQDKTLKDFMKIFDDEHSLYVERTFKKSNRYFIKQFIIFGDDTVSIFFVRLILSKCHK